MSADDAIHSRMIGEIHDTLDQANAGGHLDVSASDRVKLLVAQRDATESARAYLQREINKMRRAMQDAGTWDQFCRDYAAYDRRREESA